MPTDKKFLKSWNNGKEVPRRDIENESLNNWEMLLLSLNLLLLVT